jgi:hypothetical protein
VLVKLAQKWVVGREGWGKMSKADERLDAMIAVADALDVPLDHVVRHMARCDYRTFKAFEANPSLLPRYTKSNVSP